MSSGHPPGHPELKAVKMIWGKMEHQVRSSLTKFRMTELKDQVDAATRSIDSNDWANAMRHVEATEQEYWKNDAVCDAVDPVVISLSGDDMDTDGTDSGEE